MPSQDLSLDEALAVGRTMAIEGRHDSALTMFKGVLIHEPTNFEAVLRMGSSLFELGRYYEALYWFWRGLKIDGRHPLALTNYGLCISQLGHAEEGWPFLERAVMRAEKLNCAPGIKALIYNNLGNTLERLGRHKEALVALDKGIAYDPDDPFPHYNRGIVLIRLNRHRDGLAAMDKSLALRPPSTDSPSRLNDADAHYNRAMARLHLGDLEGGFADYEYRLLTTSTSEVPNLNLPADLKWDGTLTPGMKLLVHCEQGLGDDIQFFRFLPALVKAGMDVTVLPHKATAPLIRTMPGVKVPPIGTTIEGTYDRWVAIMSLPFYLGVKSEADIPAPFAPLIETERVEKWCAEIAAVTRADATLRVAICWAGQFQHKNDHHRSIALSSFSRMFCAPCQFISVQQMRSEDEAEFADLKRVYPNLMALRLTDFRDTAAVLFNCDVVVCVDTSVAHLAASLGIPTKILLPRYATDWRWGLERTDSPWYPSVTLYRQATVGAWAGVIGAVKRDLAALSGARAAT